ncbi:MAG TPA: DUF2017 family protein [Verrucomicrobiae bacterium]|nr:DUF2017 family protein [Verrucomicrobiae bacterium]
MIDLHIERLDEKHVRIGGLTTMLAVMLREMPEILEMRDGPGASARLFPNPTLADAGINKEWQQMVSPELRHLFVSAAETVTRDLTTLTGNQGDPEVYEVTFPVEHLNAWMSALNQTRLILAEVHKIDEEDMERQDFDPQEPKHLAALRIHLLGYLLHLFVELENGNGSTDCV